MPTFRVKAKTAQGKIIVTKVNDANKSSCIKKVKRNGLTPIAVNPIISFNVTPSVAKMKRKNSKSQEEERFDLVNAKVLSKSQTRFTFIDKVNQFLRSTEKISSRDIRVFTQNFYLLKKANFNNIHALQTVIETTENPKFKIILEDILAGVESGEFMYTTMEYYSTVFPYIYINMIKVGELSGSLEQSLEQAVTYLDGSDALTKKLKKILLPNIAMFVGIMVMLIVAVIVGVPLLQGLFASIGSDEELPEITLKFADFVEKVRSLWYIELPILGGFFALFWMWKKTPRGHYRWDYFKYTMPVFGKLIYSLDFTRLMRNILLNLQNGMRIQDSMEVSKNVCKNTVMLSIIETSINNIFTGQSWITPFEDSGLTSAMATEMLKIGMQTDLAEMIDKLLEYMQADIDNTLEKIVKVLPEISYAVVGVVLIFFVLVVLVPCINVYMGGFMFSAYGL